MSEQSKHQIFCALFDIKNEHIIKDHGLLTWGMHEYYNYNSFFATYKNDDYPNLKYLPGVKMEFIPKKSGNWLKDSCSWLRKNAKRIDVLFIYHLRRVTLSQALIYKIFNPRGKIYLKLDGWPLPREMSFFMRKLMQLEIKLCDCVSTEFRENTEILSRSWKKKIIPVANPVNPNEIQDFKNFSQRQNIILTVGRLGTYQKATEILLESFARISAQIPNWTLKLAGYIAENLNIADDFYAKYPDLRERVIFTGEIRDREQLINFYRDAKIFAFPSRFESFGIALTEAMSQGCFAVVSDIQSSRNLTENFKFALSSKVDDIDGLAKNLLYACTHENETEKSALEGRKATLERCNLKFICDSIIDELK
ncbi:MAG: glycosyltransferase family 4 protein [Synergistaceae bacterium]|nr:glycosyltransferase family 4 protein [Synergistaceae bacterium]